jgi:hypothetical protein
MLRTILLTAAQSAVSVSETDVVLRYAGIAHRRMIFVECAGMFWIFAELAILFSVLIGRRYLETEPLCQSIVLTPRERRRAVLWAAGFLIAAVLVLSRHAVRDSLPAYLSYHLYAGAEPSLDLVKLLYVRDAHAHLATWAVFVTLWVLLEAAIVYHGWRGFCRLKMMLNARVATSRPETSHEQDRL